MKSITIDVLRGGELKSHVKAKCEHCGKTEILKLLEYKNIDILIWLCDSCHDKMTKRVDRISKRIKRFILHPRGGKK